MLSEVSQKERQIFYVITYMQNQKTKQTSEYNNNTHTHTHRNRLNTQKQTHRYREQMSGYRGESKGQDRGRGWEEV